MCTVKIFTLQEAKSTIRMMTEKGLQTNIEVCNAILQCFCTKGEIKEAIKVLSEIIFNGIVPSTVMVSLFLEYVCRFSQLDKFLDSLPVIFDKDVD